MNGMKTLEELINNALLKFGVTSEFQSVSNFIENDEKSAAFIRYMLGDNDYTLPSSQSDLYTFAKARARHSAITFLTGLAFSQFEGLFSSLHSTVPVPVSLYEKSALQKRLWLITSLYHDKAYYSELIKKATLDYSKQFKFNLLTDKYADSSLSILNNFSQKSPHALAHTYEQILLYDSYARAYHSNKKQQNPNETEMIDHGILGGMMVFNDLVRKYLKKPTDDVDLLIFKVCCLTIAQHNIFKSDTPEHDKEYEDGLAYLHHDSEFRIGMNTPLLLLMSLVDTLECVKKLSKGQNENHSLQTLTVLSSINLIVEEETITIDYTRLHKEIEMKKDSELSKKYISYIDSVKRLEEWTDFRVETTSGNPYVFRITLQTTMPHKEKNLLSVATS